MLSGNLSFYATYGDFIGNQSHSHADKKSQLSKIINKKLLTNKQLVSNTVSLLEMPCQRGVIALMVKKISYLLDFHLEIASF